MNEVIATAVSAVLVAILGGGGLAQIMTKRNTARLADAQAKASDVTTMEVVDRIAREALEAVERRVKATEADAKAAREAARVAREAQEHSDKVLRAAFAYIERLVEYVASPTGRAIPPMPADLVQYLGQ